MRIIYDVKNKSISVNNNKDKFKSIDLFKSIIKQKLFESSNRFLKVIDKEQQQNILNKKVTAMDALNIGMKESFEFNPSNELQKDLKKDLLSEIRQERELKRPINN